MKPIPTSAESTIDATGRMVDFRNSSGIYELSAEDLGRMEAAHNLIVKDVAKVLFDQPHEDTPKDILNRSLGTLAEAIKDGINDYHETVTAKFLLMAITEGMVKAGVGVNDVRDFSKCNFGVNNHIV